MPSWLAVLSTLAGAIIGALLRPLLDNYFELRRKTLRVDLSAGSESLLPGKYMKIVWETRTFTRLVHRPFTIENRSGRSFKNFLLKIELLGETGRPGGEQLLFEVVLSEAHSASFDNVTGVKVNRPANGFQFHYIEPKGRVHGYAVANCDGVLKFTAPEDDLEIAVILRKNRLGSEDAQRLLALVSLALAILTLNILWPGSVDDILRWFAQSLGIKD